MSCIKYDTSYDTILPLTGITWSEYEHITGESQAYEYCMIDDRPFDRLTKKNAGRYTSYQAGDRTAAVYNIHTYQVWYS